MTKESKYAWQDNLYYIKESGAILGKVVLENGSWLAYVDDRLNWKYISKETAQAGVERVVDMEDKVRDQQYSCMIREIKKDKTNEDKPWWRFWK